MKSVMGTKACAVNRGVICLATAGFPAFLCYGGCLSFLPTVSRFRLSVSRRAGSGW